MSFFNRKFSFKEEKEHILSQLEKREWELRREWLFNLDSYLSITNASIQRGSTTSQRARRKFSTLSVFFLRIIPTKIVDSIGRLRYRDLSALGEIKEIEKRGEEIAKAREYFREVEDSEEDYHRNRAKELLPWSEQIISYSLQLLPFKKWKEIEEKKRKDPYLQFLHWYAFLISFFLTGGLIVFYVVYKKSKNPRYKFLESPLSKHVIERQRFEECLSEIVSKKVNFDSLENLKYCLNNTFSDLTYNSSIETRFMRSSVLKSLFLLVTSILTGGFLPMYIYILSSGFNRENFYSWWMRRKNIERERIEELGNITRKWWGRGVKSLRKLWSDYHFTSYLAGLTTSLIAKNFLSLGWKSPKLNYSLFWMYTMPRPRFFISLLLLALSYAFFAVWITFSLGSLSTSHWSFPSFIATGALFLFLFGYQILLII